MRVVFLSNHIPPYRISTLIELRQRVERLDVVLSSMDCAPGLPENGIPVHLLPAWHLPQRRRHSHGYVERYTVHVPRAVIRTLRRLNPDCVVAPEFGLRTALAAIYCRLYRRGFIIHADLSEDYERGRDPLRLMLRRLLLRLSYPVLANGGSARRYLNSLGCPDESILELPYASDLEHFGHAVRRPAPVSTLRLLYVGQLIERKGLEPFIEALAEAVASRSELKVVLTLAGSGDQASVLQAMPRPGNLRIRLRGPVDYRELDQVYARHDVFVMPSLGDTWGLVVNESMTSGLPVLGSRQAQAVLEMVADGEHGWVFDACDPADVRRAIARCLNTSADDRLRMGEAARSRAHQFTPARSALQILRACELAHARRGRDPAVHEPTTRSVTRKN